MGLFVVSPREDLDQQGHLLRLIKVCAVLNEKLMPKAFCAPSKHSNQTGWMPWPPGYKILSMLNSIDYKIYHANTYQNVSNC